MTEESIKFNGDDDGSIDKFWTFLVPVDLSGYGKLAIGLFYFSTFNCLAILGFASPREL